MIFCFLAACVLIAGFLAVFALPACLIAVALGWACRCFEKARGRSERRVLLATDRARAAATAALADGYAEGRLDGAELERRTEAALTARTSADLAALFSDLPAPRPFAPMFVICKRR